MICWINPSAGLAGDMLLAALIDAGASLGEIRAAITATGLADWELTAERVTDHGLSATRIDVRVTDNATHRRAADLIEMASRTTPAPVAALAVAAITAIAEAEAAIHGSNPATIHLHELGGHDTLIDIVGTAAALHALGVTDIVSAPLPLGTGQITTAHGVLPCPAPATLALLRGAAVTGTDLAGETVTPTAAALLAALLARYGPPPPMTLHQTGYGAGTRRLSDRPNVASVTLGSAATPSEETPVASVALGSAATPSEETAIVLETNLDDVTGETLAHVIARALAAGARDAWATAAVMKKGRPGYVLHAITAPADTARLQQLILAETGSLGIRRTVTSRSVLPRWSETIFLDGIPIRIKHGPHRAKPEHEDLASAAAHLGLPLHTIAERAILQASHDR